MAATSNNKKRRVLGIDCGSAIVGWSIMEDMDNKLHHVACGAIKTSSKVDMPLRLKKIHVELLELIDEFKPQEMAIEDLFFFKNKTTVITVSQARGVTVLAGAERDLPVFDYTPPQVKMAVTGYGRAEKKQVQFMVAKILGLKQAPKLDDIADAMAVSVCHLNSTRGINLK